jgi:hypothetical protein
MPERRRRGGLVLLFLSTMVLHALSVTQAAARVVGIVFDDSGSMTHYIQSPTFGVQLLLSTLDGRAGNDRVFTVRLSEIMRAFGTPNGLSLPPGGVTAGNVAAWLRNGRGPVGRQEAIGTEDLHQRTINDIATNWPHAVSNTPYEAIEVMLDRLTTEVQDGEEAFLVILTDGEFSDPPDVNRVRQSYARYWDRLMARKARLTVEFLLIAPSRPELVGLVDQQGVRGLLLEMFNGAADGSAGGRYDITNLGDLQEALKDIIARVWSIDRRQQAHLIKPGGSGIAFETPLSVTRLIAVGTALDPARAPRLTPVPAGVVETRHLTSMMRLPDMQPPLTGQRLVGDTTQLRMQPALSPGNHTVSFDRPVGQDVFLLFETNARVELTVTRPNGTPARRQGDSFLLARGESYRLEARLVDNRGGAGPVPVELSTMPHRPDVSVALDTQGGPRTVALQIEPGHALASGTLTSDAIGTITARAQARLEGFVSPPSNPVSLQIVDAGVGFSQSVEPAETCADCAPGEVRVTIAGDGQPRPVAEVTVTPMTPIEGRAKLDLSGLPAGFTASWPDGSPIPPGAEVPLKGGQPIRLRLGLAHPEQAAGGVPLKLRVIAQDPLSGSAEVALRLRPMVPAARLVLTGHSAGGPDTPLPLSGENLTDGGAMLDFSLTGALKAPAPAETEASGGSSLLWFAPVLVNGYTLQLEPRSRFLCLCFLGLGPRDRMVTLRWRHSGGLQEAAATGNLRLALGRAETALSCGAILLLLLLLLWLLLAVITTLRTRRFPRGSVAEIAEGRQLPRHADLRGRNFTFLRSLLPWRAFRLAPPHERTTVEGLTIEARGGGGTVLLGLTDGDFRVVRLGDSAAELRVLNPRLERLPVIWNDEIERRQYGKVLIRLLSAMPTAIS